MINTIFRKLHVTAALSMTACLAVQLSASAGTHPRTKAAAGHSEFVTHARELRKAKDAAGIVALAAKPNFMKWIEQRSFRGPTEWKLASLPASGGTSLAVFYDFHTCESIGDHIHPIVSTNDGLRFGPEIKETETGGFRVRDHNMSVKYDLARAGCKISDDVTIERTDAKAADCLLRLSSDMALDSSSMTGKAFPVKSVPGIISFKAPIANKFTVHLAYHGTVNHAGSDYIKDSEAVLCSYWYP